MVCQVLFSSFSKNLFSSNLKIVLDNPNEIRILILGGRAMDILFAISVLGIFGSMALAVVADAHMGK